ncbi:hypothetical protein BpHYR1_027850 [Brachionus plicatilis]|uniref:Uncharacterized protein n=1 Tax=Brachionus plicatilis TaxID=10195 RepID=A0A3M7RPB1_BRAPC|nr:hypothetical protein BpHYR1_027850 [Brachionus plicatilis]
MCTFSFFNP